MKMSSGKVAAVALLACLSFAASSPNRAAAQTAKTDYGIRLRASGRGAVVIRERGRAHVLDLRKLLEAAKIDDAREIFRTRRGDFIYLLLQVCGPSKLR